MEIICDSSESRDSFIQQIFIQQFSETHSCGCKTHQKNTSLETSAQVAASVVLLNENVRPDCTCHAAVSKHDCTGKRKKSKCCYLCCAGPQCSPGQFSCPFLQCREVLGKPWEARGDLKRDDGDYSDIRTQHIVIFLWRQLELYAFGFLNILETVTLRLYVSVLADSQLHPWGRLRFRHSHRGVSNGVWVLERLQ